MILSSSSATPILVVGAGPTGLILALTLAKNGIPLRIIDKAPKFHTGQRGGGVQPRTLEIWNSFGILPDLLAKSTPIPPVRLYKFPGGVEPIKTFHLLPQEDSTPSAPYMNAMFIGQNHIEAILRSHLETYGHHVELSTELRSFEQRPDGVTAQLVKSVGDEQTIEMLDCHWLVAADGGKSAVRKQLGLTFVGETLADPMIIGEIEVTGGLDRDHWHRWRDGENLVALRPIEAEGIFSFILARNGDNTNLLNDRDALIKAMQDATDRKDIVYGDIKYISEWRPNARMVETFEKGWVFLAGDAAHVHTPAGGQGLNSSIQDGLNLAWKLVLVEKGLASPSLLSTYTEERLPVIADMLQITTRIFENNRAVTGGGPLNVGAQMKQLGVNYRWSSIVVEERGPLGVGPKEDRQPDTYGMEKGGELRAGDRAPDAPGLLNIVAGAAAGPSALFHIFSPMYHTVLIFSTNSTSIKSIVDALTVYPSEVIRTVVIYPEGKTSTDAFAVEGTQFAFVDGAGHAYAGYGVPKEDTAVAIVRPDSIVGGMVTGVEGVKRYFKGVFSAGGV